MRTGISITLKPSDRRRLAALARDLKVGIHRGPAIAVTLNDRLDYFGQTVNSRPLRSVLARGHDTAGSG